MMHRLVLLPFAAALLLVLAGCPSTSPGASAAVVSVDIDHGAVTLAVETSTALSVTVVVVGGASDAVAWSSDDAGIAAVSDGGVVTGIAAGTTMIRATSTVDASRTASVSVTVISDDEEPDVEVAILPAAVELAPLQDQAFTATVTGTNDTSVTWSTTCGTIDGTTNTITYTAPAEAGQCEITATSTADPTKTATANVTVTSAPVVSVTVAPATATMTVNETTSFTATVTGTTDLRVTWSTTCGTIDGTTNTITYTAPAEAGQCEITATSTADPTKTATANVTVTSAPVVSVTVAPATATMTVNETTSFTATVTGTTDTSVTWSTTCGTIDGTTNTITYTAPAEAGQCEITATSTADPTKTATANVTVEPAAGGFEPAPSYISISNVSVGAASGGTRRVTFDISWPESWRGPDRPTWVAALDNWDAAWVFMKYRVAGGAWQHATLAGSGHVVPAGAVVDVPSDRVGTFLYRSSSGYGTFTANGVGLQWDYLADGVSASASVEVQPFAIEMVYVPQGSFWLGSGGSSRGEFRAGGTTSTPFVVSSQSSIALGDAPGHLMWTTGSDSGSPADSTNASFPTGFEAFYLMKHQVTQGQYVNFLNTLTQTQADARKHTEDQWRYAITGDSVGSFVTSLPFVGLNYVSWEDGAAFADWAGLRPMTELEFEKVARGPNAPVANDNAWGTGFIIQATDLLNAGTISETPTPVDANANHWTLENGSPIQGPVRVGSFASPGRSRQDAGAGYYGALELSGNLFERPVTVGNAEGRAFAGTHGDGVLDEAGNANVVSWPDSDAVGIGGRGGGWNSFGGDLQVSHRQGAAPAFVNPGRRSNTHGWRAARSAP